MFSEAASGLKMRQYDENTLHSVDHHTVEGMFRLYEIKKSIRFTATRWCAYTVFAYIDGFYQSKLHSAPVNFNGFCFGIRE